jgi:protease-4
MIDFLKKIFSPITATLNFIQNYFKSLVFIFIVLLVFGGGDESGLEKPNLMQIDVHGPILNADAILAKFDRAKESDIKGILVDIDSPGGAVSPSIEIADAIKRIKKLKPVVVYASGTMTSGGYYSAIWADTIIANPGSLVGSIGVIIQSANIKKLLDEIGIVSQSAKKGTYKEVGTPAREWSKLEKEEIQKVIDDTYDMFITDVATARGLKKEEHTIYADAHIFTARQAQKIGLVDKVDTKYRAINELKMLSGVSEAIWVKDNKMDRFLDRFVSETTSKISTQFSMQMR